MATPHIHRRIITVVHRASTGWCAVPGGPGGLPVRVGGEVGSAEVPRPGTRGVGDKKQGGERSQCDGLGEKSSHLHYEARYYKSLLLQARVRVVPVH
jgi:hypothetical protein